jgi:hypothetical protein
LGAPWKWPFVLFFIATMAYEAWRIPSRRTVGLGMLVESDEAPWFLSHEGITRRHRILQSAEARTNRLLAVPQLPDETRREMQWCIEEIRRLIEEVHKASEELVRMELAQEEFH